MNPDDISAGVVASAALCRKFEGTYLRPYLCPSGVPTIGVGATFYEDGRRVTMSDPPITAARVEQLLQWMLRTQFLPEVLRLCHGIETPGQLGALVDFAYNCGVGNLRASTLRKRVNAGRWDDVPAEFRKWTRGGGKVLRGLVRRREAEIALL